MRSKLNGILLFLIAAFLLLLSKSDFLYDLLGEWRMRRKSPQTNLQNPDSLRFERQRLEYQTKPKEFKNPVLYFEVVRIGELDFKSYQKSSKKIEDGSTPENASESN